MRFRSLLFAPAVRPDLLRKLPRAGADAVVIDCEDATPVTAKEEGRQQALAVGAELVAGGTSVFVRVNAVGTPWFADDIAHGLAAGVRGVVLPMVEETEQLDEAADALGGRDLEVVAGVETAAGLAAARALFDHPIVSAGYFGAEDFIADMGGVRTHSNMEVMHARAEVALAGRLARVPVLDQVVVEFGDSDRFRREAAEARALGFAGKLCIHPAQVQLAHAAFTPSAEEVEEATAIIAAYERAERDGRGVIVFAGRMIDGPLVSQARRVLAAAD
ncbi:MAG TPA: CoA ester lyase [Acidimicrobiia bacterium]|nr:CoA ester lyase [Acidimicrobiia bacterium]